jgi:nicotinamide-nucleotide amidase
VSEARTRAEVIITTGGLGPTSDDLTRQCIAELLGKTLIEQADILAHIASYFQTRRRPMPTQTRVQALVPAGATVLMNRNGTAPGLVLEMELSASGPAAKSSLLIMLPGPPRELQPMFSNQVLPLLEKRFPIEGPFVCRVLRTTGLGESSLEAKVAPALEHLVKAGLELGYCARFGEVDVRLLARTGDAPVLVNEAEWLVRDKVGKYVYGSNDDSLEAVLVKALAARRETVAVAESCTGGYIANRLTNVPGASDVFLGGLVTYSNEAKHKLLGVPEPTLANSGAVSEPVARAMAEGARLHLGADYALAVTGIAGPTGGTPEKPVGTVYLALASSAPTVVLRQVNPYDRESFKFVTSQQALDLLRRSL